MAKREKKEKSLQTKKTNGNSIENPNKAYLIGNQFWKFRTKHGRNTIFANPEILWQCACEYFESVDENPFLVEEAIKVGDLAGTTMTVKKAKPYTLKGLCLYLDISDRYFIDFEEALEKNGDPLGFSQVITRIRNIIFTQKFEGASAGLFNPVIISRDLGLQEKVKSENTIKIGTAADKEEYE
jgi:hypothetical protein